ncbi:MAG: hypothetical protein NC453_19600 [Muribaculum sp.]|nr:hypothetical protein [Muribaculum sp.]
MSKYDIITTRQELCNALVYLKEHKEVRLNDVLQSIFKMTPQKIADIENPEAECKLSDVMLYLQMCKGCMEIALYNEDDIDEMDQLRRFLKIELRESNMSIVDMAKKSRVSSHIIDKFIYGKGNMTVDSFLKIVNAMDISLKII